MTRSPRRRTIRTLALALVAVFGVAGVAAPHVEAAPVAVPAAGEGLCIDLSALGLPSICVGSLL